MKKQKNAPQILPREEWPYEVPENWVWTRLENISQTISKGTTPAGGKTVYTSKGIPFLRVENILDNGIISHKNIQYISKEIHLGELKRSILQENDVLVSIAGTLAKTTIISCDDVPMNTNQAIAFIRLHETMKKQSKFIKWAFSSPVMQKLLLTQTKVTAIPNLTLKILSEAPIPLPPLPEQQRIVARIESLFAKLDAAAEKIRASLDQFPTRKAAILHKAFTGELTKKWRNIHHITAKAWTPLTLNDVADYKKGPFGSSITKVMFVPKGKNTYKVYEQGNAIRKTLDYGHYYITEQKYNELKSFAIQAGDIIISCAGTIGEVYKLPTNCEAGVINQALMRVRLYPNIDEGFFIYYFCGVIKGNVIDKANGTAIQNIPPFKVMKAMEIRLPPLPEQQEIVRVLDAIFESEQAAKETAERLLEQIALTKKSILARAFRGLLGTNDPKEESAEGWLEEKNL